MENSLLLSIVVVGRNDNYGGDFTSRFQNCVDWNTELLEKNKVAAELVFINWNPIENQPSLKDIIKWPRGRKKVSFRFITVPFSHHKNLVDRDVRDTVPLFEFIAKNVGIRRSKGKYILCINADVLLHPKIVAEISKQELSQNTYFRADRLDYNAVATPSVNGFYRAAEFVALKGFMYRFNPHLNASLQYKIFKYWNKLRIWTELFKFNHQSACNKLGINVVYNNGAYLAHCHNSGDFMLMLKQNWHALKGYPEYTSISTHTDALFTILAFSKLKEEVFSVPVFHQMHERRYDWNAIKEEPKFVKAYDFFERVSKSVRENKAVEAHYNDDNWGAPEANFEELFF